MLPNPVHDTFWWTDQVCICENRRKPMVLYCPTCPMQPHGIPWPIKIEFTFYCGRQENWAHFQIGLNLEQMLLRPVAYRTHILEG